MEDDGKDLRRPSRVGASLEQPIQAWLISWCDPGEGSFPGSFVPFERVGLTQRLGVQSHGEICSKRQGWHHVSMGAILKQVNHSNVRVTWKKI